MQAIPRSPFFRFVVIPLTLVAWLSGCYSWSATQYPNTVIRNDSPERIRLTLSDSSVVELRSPELRADSIAGLCAEACTARGDSTRVIALADVTKFEVRKSHTAGNIATVFIAAAIVGLIAVLVTAGNELRRR